MNIKDKEIEKENECKETQRQKLSWKEKYRDRVIIEGKHRGQGVNCREKERETYRQIVKQEERVPQRQ